MLHGSFSSICSSCLPQHLISQQELLLRRSSVSVDAVSNYLFLDKKALACLLPGKRGKMIAWTVSDMSGQPAIIL